MNVGQTVFAQLMEFASRFEFRGCGDHYRGDYKVQSFSCWDPVCEPRRRSFITWGCGEGFLAIL
jgi:hypothetical protein